MRFCVKGDFIRSKMTGAEPFGGRNFHWQKRTGTDSHKDQNHFAHIPTMLS